MKAEINHFLGESTDSNTWMAKIFSLVSLLISTFWLGLSCSSSIGPWPWC